MSQNDLQELQQAVRNEWAYCVSFADEEMEI